MRRDGRRDNQSVSDALLGQVLDQELDVSSIAAQLGYSTDGFIRAFRRQFGLTPVAYRLAHRLLNARSLLKKGGTVADAIWDGFSEERMAQRLVPIDQHSLPREAIDFVPDA
jgi:methylphosphotriester-DNA--protein-cysteine methyltransferase